MSCERPFRFGVTAHPFGTAKEWRELARSVEDLGYSTLYLPDHLGEQPAPFVSLAVAAEVTTLLRVGVLVAANDFRHPVVHAKEVATLDVLSDGRVDWGMGAGWLTSEYEAAGIPFDSGAVRFARLTESVSAMRLLFEGGPVHHHGTYYELDGIEGSPPPRQRPHPPLLLGGAQKRILSFAAREADIVGIAPSLTTRPINGPPRHTTAEAVDLQVEWIRNSAGDRFDALELTMVAFPAAVTTKRAERAERAAEHLGVPPDQVLASPHVILGTVGEICEDLQAHRRRWDVSNWVVPARSARALGPVVERLAGD